VQGICGQIHIQVPEKGWEFRDRPSGKPSDHCPKQQVDLDKEEGPQLGCKEQ